MTKKSKATREGDQGGGGLGGFFGGLADLVEKLNDLSETGKQMSGTGRSPIWENNSRACTAST